ncbi:hypothetical protein LTR95_008907 [Oleoguttula sp. CCFEE 5521]
MNSIIDLGTHASLTHTRYTITLSTSSQIILFRLPTLSPSVCSVADTSNSTLGWTYYAMESVCPHAGGPMADSHVDLEDSGYVASCPWHAYDFDLRTGESSFGVKACVFPVVISDDLVSVEIPGREVTLVGMEGVSEVVEFKHDSTVKDSARMTELADDVTMCEWCVHILNTSDPERKIELTTQLFSNFATREQTSDAMIIGAGTAKPPDEPPREALQAVKPWEMPNPGRGGTLKSRVTMLHALANVEQWAIDLALDICVRFAAFRTSPPLGSGDKPQPLPRTFFYDWLRVANDEAKHFSLLRARLEAMGSHFGALPVHHGLWESARLTSEDLRARISIIALVHEARGLDINPLTIAKFRTAKDLDSVGVLEIIHRDEVTHVTTGHRWLSWICEQEGTQPVEVFRGYVMKYFRGAVKGPFNTEARAEAGMDACYYTDLAGGPARGHVVAGG